MQWKTISPKKTGKGAVENHLTKKPGEGAVGEGVLENIPPKKTRGKCSGGRCIVEPSHQKNQGEGAVGEGVLENHPTIRTRGRCSAETFN